MKKTLVIVGHPDLNGGSLANRLIVDRLEQESEMEIRNLAELYPDFAIDVAAEQDALLRADTVVLQFPFHWYSVPGILKEWIDKVLAYGFAYGSAGTKLNGKNFLLSSTIGGPVDAYCRGGYNTYTIEELMRPLHQTAKLCGMNYIDPVISHGMIYIPDVYNVKEEVEGRAREHGEHLVACIAKVA